jgi:DNA helicase-2/ATP-dependent DNA helicase PcrA
MSPVKLNEAQQAVVDYTGGPLLVLACPGSGKTRSLTELMIAMLERDVDPVSILAVTFTNKAADEMKERVLKRVPGNQVHISTFHSLCASILRTCAHLLGYKRNFSICDDGDQNTLMRRLIKLAGLDPKEHDPKRYIGKLEKKKNTLTSDEDFYKGECDAVEASIFKDYQDRLKAANSMDFSDLLTNVITLFDKFPQVQEAYSTRFKYVLVDEMQDTNLAQLELVRRLVTAHGNIVVVGDADQVIYSWRQARPENILHFEKYFPSTKIIKLEENYRSTPEILAVAQRLIDKNTKRKQVELKATRGAGSHVKYIEYQNLEDQAEEVARIIDGFRLDGHNYGDVAVLCRVNSLTRQFEESFRRNEIPYVLIGAFGFYDRKEVKTALSYMRFLANPEDVLAFEEAVGSPSRGVGTASVTKLVSHAVKNKTPFIDTLRAADKIKGVPKKAAESINSFLDCMARWDESKPVTSLNEIFESSGFVESVRSNDRAKGEHREDNVTEVLRGFASYCRRKQNPSISQYLQEISLLTSADDQDQENAVKLMTVHAAKGLEFPIVIVPGFEEEVLPHKRSIANGDIEEERRIAYVAVTRAMDHLILCRSLETFQSGGPTGSVPSRFLVDMGFVKTI